MKNIGHSNIFFLFRSGGPKILLAVGVEEIPGSRDISGPCLRRYRGHERRHV